MFRQFAGPYQPVKLFTVKEVLGGWAKAQKVHFDDGGEFDKVFGGK